MAGREETVDDREILQLFVDSEDPILGTSEIAEKLDFSVEGARKRLLRLEEEGLLDYKNVGGNAWWITAEGKSSIE